MEEDYQALINLSLGEKIEKSKDVIRRALREYPRDKLYVAWTGGKDSTTMLWLYRQVCQEDGAPLPNAMFIDEGHVFSEILDLVEEVKTAWNVKVAVVKNTDLSEKARQVGDLIRVADLNDRNRLEIEKLAFTEPAFPFEPESYVGNHLMKTVAMNMFMENQEVVALSTAIRWDEQEARIEESYFSQRQNPDHTRIHPILHFRERDIWDTIHQEKIPFCSLYYQGYRSLGAKGSTTKDSDLPAWEQDLENTTERAGRGQDKEQIMSRLRSLGYM